MWIFFTGDASELLIIGCLFLPLHSTTGLIAACCVCVRQKKHLPFKSIHIKLSNGK